MNTHKASAVVCFGVIWLIIGGILLGKQEFLSKSTCTVTNKSFSPYQCYSYINLCRPSRPCKVPCDTENYHITYEVIHPDIEHPVRACGFANTVPVCNCCTNTSDKICNQIEISSFDPTCKPIIEQDLNTYNTIIIGQSYDCWKNNKGTVYMKDKSHSNENLYISMIVIAAVCLLSGVSVLLYLMCCHTQEY